MKLASLRVLGTSLFVFGALALSAASSQGADGAEDEASIRSDARDALRERFTFEGTVLEASGAPAAGARVVTSAGGRAVADAQGRYRLEVGVASGAASVQVSAAGGAGPRRAASVRVALPARSGSVQVGALVLASSASCEPSWVPTFGEQAGTNGRIRALATYDDGNGPALYAGGEFRSAGGVEAVGIARWDGASWSSLGSGAELAGEVYALVAHDDGSGPALFVGGRFTSAGGVSVNHVAKWDGSSWAALGSGVTGGFETSVRALAVFDDGSGPALYAGGDFTSAGGAGALRVARWDGSAWTALGPGLKGGAFFPPTVEALAVHDDGSGPALHAGGSFGLAGTLPVSNVASWDGSAWAALGSGTSNLVYALASHDDGSGPALYAGGHFGFAGGQHANRVARWDGASWTPLGSGTDDVVLCLTVHDDGGGAALYAGGEFTSAGGDAANGVARWDGAGWQALGSGIQSGPSGYGGVRSAQAMAAFDDGSGTVLVTSGGFTRAGGIPVSNVASWDGSGWAALGGGPDWIDGPVSVLAEYDDGGGPALHAGGAFSGTGGQPLSPPARWDGSGWTALGLDAGSSVTALAQYDDGSGPALHVAGSLVLAGSPETLAKWDGASWTAIDGIDGWITTLAVHDDGGGPALFVGGDFATAGGLAVNDVARWDGSGWSPLGGGLGGSGATVEAMTVWDDGGGPALFVGGSFTSAGGASAHRIAKWDGASWSALGNGVGATVYDLAVHDGGLYAGGLFLSAGFSSASRVARWDGSSWTALGDGIGNLYGVVYALAAHDDGSGPALYAGGYFSNAGALAVSNLARWDGSSWSALGRGTNGVVHALASRTDDGWPALYVSGSFGSALDSGDASIAKWGCLDLAPTLACPSAVQVLDRFDDAPGAIVTYTVTATDDHDPAPTLACVPPSGSFFPRGTTLVTCTATDANGHVSTCDFPVVVALELRRAAR